MSDPRIWGWDWWKTNHRAAQAYPEKTPDAVDKQKMRDFLQSQDGVLPCPACRLHYRAYLDKHFNDNVLKNRKTLSRFIYDLHEAVNNRLGAKHSVKFEDVPGIVNKFPTRYVDLDTGLLLDHSRYSDAGGVSSPEDRAARQWLAENVGHGLNERSLFDKLFMPIGPKQMEMSQNFIYACLALLLALSLLTNAYLLMQNWQRQTQTRQSQKSLFVKSEQNEAKEQQPVD